MKTTIIYHDVKPGVPCPDGLAAAWVAAKLYPDAELRGWAYQSDNLPTAEKSDCLIIVDFSFSSDVIEQWIRSGVLVTVLDHHKTAQEALSKFYVEDFMRSLAVDNNLWQVEFDMNECGATLAWKTFFPNQPVPTFLEYVRDRDLWNHTLPMTEEIHEATSALRRSFALFDVLQPLNQAELIKLLAPLGEKLLQPKREKIKAIASRWKTTQLEGTEYKVPVVKLAADGSEDRLTSDVCSYLYKRMFDVPFVACITSDGSWSLRSDKHGNNTDVGAIAQAKGGGGHRNAAGFKPAN